MSNVVLHDRKIGLDALISRLVNGHLLFNNASKVIGSQGGEAKFSLLCTSLRNICSFLKISDNGFGLFVNLGVYWMVKQGCAYLAALIATEESYRESYFVLITALVSERL